MSSVLRRNAFQPSTTRPMVGDTKTSMVRVDHIGWLVCDGRSLTRTEYRSLFNVLGTEFGSVDANHFNLPNAQGRVMGLIGMATGVSPATNWVDGDVSGEEVHTLTIAEMPAHRHGSTAVSGNTDGTGLTGMAGGHNHDGATGEAGTHEHSGTTSLEGNHFHGVSDSGHTHSSNAVGGQGNSGLAIADGTNTATAADSSQGELNVWTTPSALDINSALSNILIQDNGIHSHILNIDPSGAHTHTITPVSDHSHTIGRTGGSQPHNNMQPTLFLGNLFIYCGLPTKNITGANGISPPLTNPSYYPPSTPANRIY
jgi:microcystin-dependent protein